MPRRAVTLAVLLLLIGAVLAAPAQAKCCALDHLMVLVPDQGIAWIGAAELDDHLSPADQSNLYWPVFNDGNKGDERPAGRLGPGYTITYLLEGFEPDTRIEVREVVYLYANPPRGFTPRGQRQDFDPGDGRFYPVVRGWRPFPESAAKALRSILKLEGFGAGHERETSSAGAMVDRSSDVSLEGDVVTTRIGSWWATFGLVTLAAFSVAVLTLWLVRRRQSSTS
jgi:hypothetical protein